MSSSELNHQDGRKATWFELFFDLVFVIAVSGLAGVLSEHYDLAGAAGFTFLFLVLWWLWLGHTFHASRFDKDRPDQWLIGFAHMIAVIFIGYGAGDAFGSRAWAFAGGVGAFKALLMLGYLREMGRPGLARLCTLYSALYAVQAALWLGSVAVDGEIRLGLWLAAFAIDLVTPFIVASETHRAPPHPEHLPERFGLFTLILLGETVAAAIHALDHGPELHGATIVVAILGAAIGFLFWVGYFRRARGQSERHVSDAAAGRNLRLWAYGHIPLYLGIASLGAGTVYLSHHAELHGQAPFIFSVGSALAMAGVTFVAASNAGRQLAASWPYLALAVLTALLPVVLHDAITLAAGVLVLAIAQIAGSWWLTRPA